MLGVPCTWFSECHKNEWCHSRHARNRVQIHTKRSSEFRNLSSDFSVSVFPPGRPLYTITNVVVEIGSFGSWLIRQCDAPSVAFVDHSNIPTDNSIAFTFVVHKKISRNAFSLKTLCVWRTPECGRFKQQVCAYRFQCRLSLVRNWSGNLFSRNLLLYISCSVIVVVTNETYHTQKTTINQQRMCVNSLYTSTIACTAIVQHSFRGNANKWMNHPAVPLPRQGVVFLLDSSATVWFCSNSHARRVQ